MPKRTRFTPNEVPTDPELRTPRAPAVHASGRAPKSRRERAEAPTLPPPKSSGPKSTPKGPPPKSKRTEPAIPKPRAKASDKPPAKRARKGDGAEIDEVVADLSRDPRRERD